MHEWDPCFYCLRRCRRKREYDRLDEAEAARQRLSPKPWDDPTLEVFVCQVTDQPHFHLGHGKGLPGPHLDQACELLRCKERLRSAGFG
jgi:hypothetical protein